jgi:hypothetical protein
LTVGIQLFNIPGLAHVYEITRRVYQSSPEKAPLAGPLTGDLDGQGELHFGMEAHPDLVRAD